MRIWITRAEPGASRTAARLTALGYEAVVAPLLAIRALQLTAPDLSDVAVIAFTSRNGVAAFANLTPEGRTLRVFAVGDATADAARQAGFTDVHSAKGDLLALADLIRSSAPPSNLGLVLHPSALQPAGDLADHLGADRIVRTLAVYEAIETRVAPPDYDVVLAHSPRAAHVLAACPAALATGRIAVAISPAAAEPLLKLPFARILTAATPDEAAMTAALGKISSRV